VAMPAKQGLGHRRSNGIHDRVADAQRRFKFLR
jgi:hypothetical protein